VLNNLITDEAKVVFKIKGINQSGHDLDFSFDPRTSGFYDFSGKIIFGADRKFFSENPNQEIQSPLMVLPNPKKLLIQMGLKCNFSCSYCLQSHHVGREALTSSKDIEEFKLMLKKNLKSAPEKVEFWGGEPLLYFQRIKDLVPFFQEWSPNTKFFLITNGSMFNNENIDYLDRNNFSIGVSHDGPGQWQRGPDPFENETTKKNLAKAVEILGTKSRLSFNVLLTPSFYKLDEARNWFAERLHINPEQVPLSYEGPVGVFPKNDDTKFEFNFEAGKNLIYDILSVSRNSLTSNNEGFKIRAHHFRQSAKHRLTLYEGILESRKFLSRKLVVDLKGNVLANQNTGLDFKIGHLQDKDPWVNKYWFNPTQNKDCHQCPVSQMCQGAEMIKGGQNLSATCKNHFFFNLGILLSVFESDLKFKITSFQGQMFGERIDWDLGLREN
jgi:uncharacterized protein